MRFLAQGHPCDGGIWNPHRGQEGLYPQEGSLPPGLDPSSLPRAPRHAMSSNPRTPLTNHLYLTRVAVSSEAILE
jgi:hypothetical protein